MHRRLKNESNRVSGDLKSVLRAVETSTPTDGTDAVEYRRRQFAEWVKQMGPKKPGEASAAAVAASANAPAPAVAPASPAGVDLEDLAPRLKQTLDGLLAGDSEKQIAAKLGLSPHTVHVYVKSLYRRFGVNSRGELLSKFVRR